MAHATRNELDRQAHDLLADLTSADGPLKPKQRMAIPPQEMPAQDPDARRGNTHEVALGYTEAQARDNLERLETLAEVLRENA
mgnify:CR=1 FL=1